MNKYEIKFLTQLGFKYKKVKVVGLSAMAYFNKHELYGLNDFYAPEQACLPISLISEFSVVRAESYAKKFFKEENLARVTVHNFNNLDKKQKNMALESARDLKESFDNFVNNYQGDAFEAYSKGFDKIIAPEMTVQVSQAYEEHMGKSPVSIMTEDLKREISKTPQALGNHDLRTRKISVGVMTDQKSFN